MRHWAQWRRRLDPWKDSTKEAWSQKSRTERNKIKKLILEKGANVLVVLPFERKSRRDPHNYVGTNVKTIIDALTIKTDRKTGKVVWDGAWPDDTPEWVTVLEPELVVGETQVKVYLIPRED